MKQKQTKNINRIMRDIERDMARMRRLFKAQNYEPEFIKLEKFAALDAIDPAIYTAGLSEMKKHKVVIAGIARDNADDLAIMMRHIESLGELFADYRVVIFENDSIDGTKEILSKWKKRNSKVSILMKDFGNIKRPSIQFLADARNYYLDEFMGNESYRNFDLMVAVDMDMSYGFDLRGIEHSFSQYDKWDMVCSNGISNSKGETYDMFAFRSAEFPGALYNTPNYYKNVTLKGQQQVFKPGDDLFPIFSGFGGMAIYKREFLKDCHYESVHDDCEHVALHECMLKRHARIFLNPAQVIRYSHFDVK